MGFLIVVAIIIIAVIYWNNKSTKGDHVVMDEEVHLRPDAKIIDVKSKPVGIDKHNKKMRTTVIFDDGFKYVSHDTEREDSFLSYRISVTPEMKAHIIKQANDAHLHMLDKAGFPRPLKPFNCGNCGHKGPYEGNCPSCGSSMKRYIYD